MKVNLTKEIEVLYNFVESIVCFFLSLLKGAKFSGAILNAWLELKTNGWP